MKSFPQLLVTIVVFIGSTIGIDFLVGALTITDLTGAYLTTFGNFPGQTGLTYIQNYLGFMQTDTLGGSLTSYRAHHKASRRWPADYTYKVPASPRTSAMVRPRAVPSVSSPS